MAIGTQKSDVISLVVRDLVFVVLAGLLLGLPFAFGTTRWLKSFLFGVRPLDPWALSDSVLLIAALSLFAGYLPAHRAAKMIPCGLCVMNDRVSP